MKNDGTCDRCGVSELCMLIVKVGNDDILWVCYPCSRCIIGELAAIKAKRVLCG